MKKWFVGGGLILVGVFGASSAIAGLCSDGDFQVCKEEAEQGDARAQYNLGTMYHQGHRVMQDYKEAYKWFRKAAEQGDAYAQFNLVPYQ